MPRNPNGPCTVVAVDPGTTSGVLVVSVKPAWLKGQGAATWEGLGNAVVFRAAYQVGRYPKRFNLDTGRSTALDATDLDDELLPILAKGQPLLDHTDEFDGRGRKTQAFYSILRGEASGVGRGDLSVVDAGEVLQVRQIGGLLTNYPEAALVIEDFTLRTQNMDREVLSSPRLRLAIETEEMLHGAGRVPFLQQPVAMKDAPDDRLKRANLYFSGMEHARDAARHAAVFFRALRTDETLREQAFPRHFKTDWEDR
jgi:hypothetical protein